MVIYSIKTYVIPLVSNEPERRLLLSLKYLRVGDREYAPISSSMTWLESQSHNATKEFLATSE